MTPETRRRRLEALEALLSEQLGIARDAGAPAPVLGELRATLLRIVTAPESIEDRELDELTNAALAWSAAIVGELPDLEDELAELRIGKASPLILARRRIARQRRAAAARWRADGLTHAQIGVLMGIKAEAVSRLLRPKRERPRKS